MFAEEFYNDLVEHTAMKDEETNTSTEERGQAIQLLIENLVLNLDDEVSCIFSDDISIGLNQQVHVSNSDKEEHNSTLNYYP